MSDPNTPPEGAPAPPEPKDARKLSREEYQREKRKLLDDVKRRDFEARSEAAAKEVRERMASTTEQRGVATPKKREPLKPNTAEQEIRDWIKDQRERQRR